MIRLRLGYIVLAVFASTAVQAGFGQVRELRTVVAGTAALSAENSGGESVSIGYADAAAVFIPKDSPFLQGVEIEFRSPPEVTRAPGGFAFEIWKSIEPSPEKGVFVYRGQRIITQPMPARAGYAFQIPLKADHSIQRSPYAELLPLVVRPSEFPIVIKMIPVSKGVLSDVEKVRFQIRCRPILGDEGALSVKFKYPDEHSVDSSVGVFVDDRKVDTAQPIHLKAGTHRLRVESDVYRDESRSFAVEAGKTLELVIELQGTTPLLSIEAPNSSEIALDGVRIDSAEWMRIEVEPGEHMISCKIGDYSLSRRFVALRGNTYKIVLEINLNVQEVP
jgi:hypothetical protein